MLDQVEFASLTLPKSLESLIQLIRQQSYMTPKIACQCVQDANIKAEDLMFWADFEHPLADSYGRHLVYEDKNFEIMVMSWAPGDFSAFHDHGAAQWGAVQSFGQAEHSIYQLQDTILTTQAILPFNAGSVIAVDHDLIHQMGNPGQESFLSLHVYGSEDHQGAVTGDARIFDLFSGKIQFTNGGVFFCLPEDLVTHEIEGLWGDRPTLLRHHQQMLDRIERMPTPLSSPLQQTTQALRDQINSLLN
ncbi:cysteine dioxygenase family protein [Acaryochloris sp. IP29b_bin.137]|uniref:cysteine dioxygenase n=1 Tax=Acaryochloris sp. IP29b_bin.137 TaxID=2969217 RepID=UPI00262DCCAB|nr:cysteine dioxygenase family protein [Acaryochloris sp. IP29b_bin.137]